MRKLFPNSDELEEAGGVAVEAELEADLEVELEVESAANTSLLSEGDTFPSAVASSISLETLSRW